MNRKVFIVVFVLFLAVLFCSGTFAETIYLKDGRVLKEKIIERGSYYIVTQSGNMPHKYYDGQIERIEEDTLADTIDMSNINVEQFQEVGMPIEKARLIVALIYASGVRQNMEEHIGRVLDKVPDEEKDYYKQLFNIDEIIERLIPLYDKYYSEKDLKEIIQFYESPAGKKVLEVTPKIMTEAIGVSVEYFKEKAAL